MKEMTVISGKGGTGKTSIVASFSALAKNKVLADCDVDAADLHLVVGARIRHREPFRGGKKARIIPERCNGCGECHRLCRFGAVDPLVGAGGNKENIFVIDPIACEGCGVCAHFCPVEAIEFKDVVNGEWFISDTRHGPMVHAKLGIAEGNSGKLVSVVRSQARGIALKQGLDIVLIDGPPGIGCPVIASVTGTDLVLAVTEPTLSALHDLERVRQLANHFNIKTVACVNKCDLNPQMTLHIEEHCREAGVEVVGRIPYDRAVTDAQIRQTSVVEYSDGLISKEIVRMWEHIAHLLGLRASQAAHIVEATRTPNSGR
ncbi:MAG: (4Fe-4S)-binding protein [Candidatus Abyssobacteria bacterium SURF_17]|uniref:(4Fe-4S)-binding protein n=1 Tax=Candidatus Abyssobacteria bacterium SURF_17 TaxID=2093361 RepID=A0A419EPN7_9BACT|nr:MAG: (4Fe-4S)-binding protein [Candidatus Abyssubacteria bacterium SURF_17]